MQNFLRTGGVAKSRLALVAWHQVCLPKLKLNFSLFSVWNRASILKQLWVVALKKYRLWVRWLHAYYMRYSYLMKMEEPKGASWMLKKILKQRDTINLWNLWGSWLEATTPQKFFINKAYIKLMGVHNKINWFRVISCNRASPRAIGGVLANSPTKATHEGQIKQVAHIASVCDLG